MSLRLIANWKLNGSKEFNQKWFRENIKACLIKSLKNFIINLLIYFKVKIKWKSL